MLSLPYIRENTELVIKGLLVRNFKNAETLVDKVIEADSKRRSVQTELDNILSESNKISKEIGKLFQSGEVQKANIAKEKTSQLKDKSKILSDTLSEAEEALNELLYQIPATRSRVQDSLYTKEKEPSSNVPLLLIFLIKTLKQVILKFSHRY